jgi:orotidine-5'-phosphate decarboxylase
MTPKDRLCVALDVPEMTAALRLAEELKDTVGLFKIGVELFVSEGPSAVRSVTRLGLKVFLDLKFHDIPNTAAGAARAATRLGVAMFNVHAAGGQDMIKAVVEATSDEAAKLGGSRPLVLAVTVLTSIDDTILENELCVRGPLTDVVKHMAELAKAAGADGVIASPQEVPIIRGACGRDFLIVTPGVRPLWAAAPGDQKRVTTPREAIALGADYIVVGRPILGAEDKVAAGMRIVEEMDGALCQQSSESPPHLSLETPPSGLVVSE